MVKRMCEWISVKERLPDKQKEYLCYYGFKTKDGIKSKQRFFGVLTYYAIDLVPHWQHELAGLYVTHWMPLPEPPKSGSE